jgi:uncharacterized protein (TIGR00290 family)
MSYKSFFNWSGGKDSSLALYYNMNDNSYSIEKLLTNVNREYRRVSMHGVREEMLEAQAEAIGIPLQKLVLPDQPTMLEYEQQVMQTMKQLQEEKFTRSIYGDIFLEDLRKYRETQLEKVGMSAVFPLWKRDTAELMQEFIRLGFKAIVVCVSSALLDESFAGRLIDQKFVTDLPKNVDPCGENGEFHTFVFDGPIFKHPVQYKKGEKVFREYRAPVSSKDNCFKNEAVSSPFVGFWFCDLVPSDV